jgi:hypothetical protein
MTEDTMAKHWIAGAIKHPGVETAKAKANGVSTHQQLEKDSHSSNPQTKRRGVLGLTLTKMSKKK